MNEDTKKKVLSYLQKNLINLLKIADMKKKVCIYTTPDDKITHIIKDNADPMETVAQSEYGGNLYNSTTRIIYTHKKNYVKEFLIGFDISENDAEEIISKIGTHPY